MRLPGETQLSAADAIEAVNAWREYQFVARQTAEAADGANWLSYLALTTTVLAGGTYVLSVNMISGGPLASAGTDFELRVEIAPAPPFMGPLVEFGVAQGRFGDHAALPFVLPPGVITADLQFRHPSGPGSLEMLGANIQLERKA